MRREQAAAAPKCDTLVQAMSIKKPFLQVDWLGGLSRSGSKADIELQARRDFTAPAAQRWLCPPSSLRTIFAVSSTSHCNRGRARMVEVSYPGVYVEEVPSVSRPIEGVATSIAAFVGATKSGPTDAPVTVRSFVEFTAQFGGLSEPHPLSYAVQHYF